ncbi:MAG: hypothetical protein WC587_00190 [Candidatus Paceibacterota bacterium]
MFELKKVTNETEENQEQKGVGCPPSSVCNPTMCLPYGCSPAKP